MKQAAIIAAGQGRRLAQTGLIKPLVPVAGAPLCHWVVRSLLEAGVGEITILLNSRGRAVRQSLALGFPEVSWSFLEADTASSWESFRLVCRELAPRAERFLVSTVDALVPPRELRRFAQAAGSSPAEAALALTAHVDDEKPLWAELGEGGIVRALGQDAAAREWVTCGLYAMSRAAAGRMPQPSAFDSLRGYLGALVGQTQVAGIPLSKTLDVDRPEDLLEAESFCDSLKAV